MVSRRSFLGHGCSVGVTAVTAVSSVATLGFARRAAAQQGFADYKALVCVLLAGGNDSYNMLVPNDDDQYAQYAAIRSDLALEQSTLLPLGGTTLGLHPNMPELQTLYDGGDVAFLANVGTLIDAVDAQAVEAGEPVPLGLFSHADQIQQWQTARPDARIAEGWGGRIGDLMQDVNVANGISMNISLSGTNVYQSGTQTSEYAINSADNGAAGIASYDDGTDFGMFKKTVVDDLLATEQDHILRRAYRQRLASAIDTSQLFVEAMDTGVEITTPFGEGNFSQALRQIARVIAARDALGACRQTFFVNVGGWDHHDEVLDNQATMLPWISQGLSEFHGALVELGVLDDVTTFTTSDFGRTLTSNGKGSDHGWGGHHIVMGGSVTGGQVYGDYPVLSATSPLDVGRGIYIPTTSVDEYFAELSLWFGVSASDLTQVLPNVERFYALSDPNPPIGFLLS